MLECIFNGQKDASHYSWERRKFVRKITDEHASNPNAVTRSYYYFFFGKIICYATDTKRSNSKDGKTIRVEERDRRTVAIRWRRAGARFVREQNTIIRLYIYILILLKYFFSHSSYIIINNNRCANYTQDCRCCCGVCWPARFVAAAFVYNIIHKRFLLSAFCGVAHAKNNI